VIVNYISSILNIFFKFAKGRDVESWKVDSGFQHINTANFNHGTKKDKR